MAIDRRKTLSGGDYRLTEESFDSSLAHKSASDWGKYRESARGENPSPILCLWVLIRLGGG